MPELIITDAGRQAAIDANNNGLTVRMAQIAVGTGQYVPVATQTTLQTQVAVADITAGVSIGTDQVQVSARFTAGAWDAYELGVFLDDGTLFAVGSSSSVGDFPTKEAGTDVVVTVTLLISDVPSGSVQVEASIQTTVSPATTSEAGIVELADESDPDTDDERAVTPALLKTRTDAIVTGLAGTAPAVLDTITELATALQNNPSVITDLLVALALRARLDGATFTGRTRGLTRPADDDGTDFATTAWVQTNGRAAVLDNGFSLGAQDVVRPLSGSVANYRWLLIIAEAGGAYSSLMVPASDVPSDTATAVTTEYLYALGTGSISGGTGFEVLNLDPVNQEFSRVSVEILGTSNHPRAMAFHGGELYTINVHGANEGTIQLRRLDNLTATGLDYTHVATIVTSDGSTTRVAQGLTSHGGVLYGAYSGNLISINPATPAATLIFDTSLAITGLTSHGGELLASVDVANGDDSIYVIDPVNDTATLKTALPIGGIKSLASFKGNLYTGVAPGGELYKVDLANARAQIRLLGASVGRLNAMTALTKTEQVSPTLGVQGASFRLAINRPAAYQNQLRFKGQSQGVEILEIVGIP